MALTQNLMLVLREDLRTDEGIVDVKAETGSETGSVLGIGNSSA